MALSEEERKERLTEMTGGLRCRCPGYQEMTRVQLKTVDGIRYGYFACVDQDKPELETRYPIGQPGLCRCALGTKPNYVSARFIEDEEAAWGFGECSEIASDQSKVPEPRVAPRKDSSTLGIWPLAVGAGVLVAFVWWRAK